MTIDETIAKYKKLANNDTTFYQEEAQQLAAWLEELKSIKENSISKEAFEKMKSKAYKKGHRQGYNKAIDDFEKEMIRSYLTEREKEHIRYKAEQLREGVEDVNNE